MADDPNQTGTADRSRINPNEDYVRYWSDKVGVTPEELKKTMGNVGPMAEDVAKALAKR